MADLVEALAAEVEAHRLYDHAATPGELTVIAGLAAGDSYTQIAHQLSISVEAARQRARQAVRKLRAKSTYHAVAIVVGRHLIPVGKEQQ